MMNYSFRYYNHIRQFNAGVLAFTNKNNIGNSRNYAKDKESSKGGCKETPQHEGKRVEQWPKPDPPPPAWRCECPWEPQPPNYDPYRIKVPDVAVPPLPPSNAKWTGLVLMSQAGQEGQGYHNQQQQQQQGQFSPYGQQCGQCGQSGQEEAEREEESQGFFGYLKSLFGRGKKGKGEGEMSMPMIECARTKGPCSVKPVPDPPPCPPPPPPPFPWIYVWSSLTFLGIMGLLYKVYLWKQLQDKLSKNVVKWRPRRKIKRPYHCKDLPACVQYLIIGGGSAGWAAHRAILEHDETAKIFFISKEDCLPYKQPPMSKHMWWNAEPPDIKKLNYVEDFRRHSMYFAECEHFMDPIKFYRKKRGPAVSIATGWCVLRVDADDHVVWVKTMCGDQPIYYERCLLAPGAKAKNLSIFKSAPKEVRDRVTTLHTIRDLEIAYRKVKSSKHVTIIGGGPLGVELAWYLGRMNKVVERPDDEEPIEFVHVVKDKGLLAGVLPEYLGEWAVEKIRCEGVTVMPKTQVYDAFPSEDGRLQLTLSNGSSLVTDYVLVAIGSEPREDLAAPSFLELDPVNGGFLVNTELEARTHLYIAGDAASFYSQWKDTRLRLTNYGSAEEQGLIAGANMTGFWTPCNMEPHFELKLGEALQVEAVGEVGACMPTIGIFKPCNEDANPQIKSGNQGDGDRPCYKKSEEYKNRYKRGMLFYLREETVVGMIFWNMPPVDDRYMAATELLRARPSYKEINMLAHLMGFEELKCDYLSEELLREPGPCIQNRRFP